MGIEQLFGKFEFEGEAYNLMLCRDVDDPDTVTLHISTSERINSGVILELFHPVRSDNDYSVRGILKYIECTPPNVAFCQPGDSPAVRKAWLLLVETKLELQISQSKATAKFFYRGETFTVEFSSLSTVPGVKTEGTLTWDEFKAWAYKSRDRGMTLFRGQGDSRFPLRTSLHRQGRMRMDRYLDDVIPNFRLHAEAALGVNLDGNDNLTSLLAIAQHYGLPTPLLDFTRSPYIAAYFAITDALNRQSKGLESVRIFALSETFLRNPLIPGNLIVSPLSTVSRVRASPINNPRLYAQQGEFLLTNAVDVEQYLNAEEERLTSPVLRAVDIPLEEAAIAAEDLKLMGLTGATMFPGLEGACMSMKLDMMLQNNKTSQ